MKKVPSLYTVANCLTALRIVLTPYIVYAILASDHKTALICFVLGMLTDFLDGFAARTLQECSDFGEILDPIADKIFISGTLTALAWLTHGPINVPFWFVVLLLVREATLLSAGFLVLRMGLSIPLEPSRWGKISTAFLMLTFSAIYCYAVMQGEQIALPSVVWLALSVLSLGSGMHYLIRGFVVFLGRSVGLK